MDDHALRPLDESRLLEGVRILTAADSDLARVVGAFGPPPLWNREPGFATLVYIILEQQVSLASARAAYNRLCAALSPVTPRAFLTLDDEALKAIGFSRQKMAYARGVAQALTEGRLDLPALAGMDNDAVRAELTHLKGVGRWTADIYLMEVLLRPDVWPAGDLALAAAVRRVKGLGAAPGPAEMEIIGLRYAPWRAVAARIYWHHYLSTLPTRASS